MTRALRRLARHLAKAEAHSDRIRQRIDNGDRVALAAIAHAEQAESHALLAFREACGHPIGTAAYTRALTEALADEPKGRRLDETAAIFEFVGQYDDLPADARLSMTQLREAAHAFVKKKRDVCNYPSCRCPFDMGPDNQCLQGKTKPEDL